MAVRPNTRASSPIDLLERVLDKGIVIDAMACVSLLGVDHVVDIDARVVVASIETYLRYAERLSGTGSVARPAKMRSGRAETTSAKTGRHAQHRRPARFSSTDPIRARGLGVRLD